MNKALFVFGFLSLIALQILSAIASCRGDNYGPDPTPPDPAPVTRATVEQALAQLDSFKGQLLPQTGEGDQAVVVLSFQTARTGEICILNECADGQPSSIQGSCEDVFKRVPQAMREERLTALPRAEVQFDWESQYDRNLSADIGFLKATLDAAFAISNVAKLSVDLSLTDVELVELQGTTSIRDLYEMTLAQPDDLAPGNVLVTAVIRGRMRVAYTAFNSANNQIELSASVVANGINVGAGTSRASIDESEAQAVIESPDAGSVVVAIFRRLQPDLIDTDEIQLQSQGVCENPNVIQNRGTRRLPVHLVDGTRVADLGITIDEQIDSDSGETCPVWELLLNYSDPELRNVRTEYDLRLRNRAGVILDTFSFSGTRILTPGDPTSPLGDIVLPKTDSICSVANTEDLTLDPLTLSACVTNSLTDPNSCL